jgi:hypothetical protein
MITEILNAIPGGGERTQEGLARAARGEGSSLGAHPVWLGPWSWMVLLYRYEETSGRVFVVATHAARSATSATGSGR